MWIHQRTYICSIDVDVSDKACLLENLSEDEKAERTHKDITSDEPHSAQCVYLCSWPHTNKTLTSQIETLEVHSLVMSRLLPFCSFLSIRLWRIFIFILKLGFYLNLMLSKLGKMSEKPFPEHCIVFFSSAHSTKEVGFVATRYDGT